MMIQKQNTLKAQGLAEFALTLILALTLLFGIIEFGWFFFSYTSVFSAAREASRVGAAVPAYKDCAGITAAAARIGGVAGVSPGSVEVRYDTGPNDTRAWLGKPACSIGTPYTANAGDRILVRITVHYNLVLPFMPAVLNRDIVSTSIRSINIPVNLMGTVPTATTVP